MSAAGMEHDQGPDSTAVRVALWRALHVRVDARPHILEDEVGLRLISPEDNWVLRPDMDPEFTKPFRASIVARSRFVEDLVLEQAQLGVRQYAILGAGLDTFAQRRPEMGSRLSVFEIDRPGTLQWKRRRLIELGFGIPEWLHFIGVDFQMGDAWSVRSRSEGFDIAQPAVVAAMGVSMYLIEDAVASLLREAATLAPRSTFVMTFLLPTELIDPAVRTGVERAEQGARASGTPFRSFFSPTEMVELARQSGFREAQHVSAAVLANRYFTGRTDGVRPPTAAEEILVATT